MPGRNHPRPSRQPARRDSPFDGRWSKVSPNRLLVVLAVIIFIAEFCAMLLLSILPRLSALEGALFDATILLLILSPAYFYMYRPFWQERQLNEEEIHNLSRQLIRTEEATRTALARDLHDEFGQVLGALQLGIETLRNSLPAGHEQLADQCGRLSRMTAQLGTQVRDVTARLRPTMLDTLGLVPTLRWHLQQFGLQHPNTEIIMEMPELDGSLPPEAAIALYRVCQESLNNVAKHAGAERVAVTLALGDGELILRIEDNGAGFEPAKWQEGGARHHPGIGILGMRERIADLAGQLLISSRPGGGTRIEARIPMSREDAP